MLSVSFRYVPADDESVDDEWAVDVCGRATPLAIQICGRNDYSLYTFTDDYIFEHGSFSSLVAAKAAARTYVAQHKDEF